MEPFRLNKIQFKCLGLALLPVPKMINKWLAWFWMLASGLIIPSSIYFIVANISNIIDATEAFYMLIGSVQSVSKLYLIWSHLEEISALFNSIQINNKRREYTPGIYQCDRLMFNFSKETTHFQPRPTNEQPKEVIWSRKAR